MPRPDAFAEIARYYDPIMDHVDYDRWFLITATLGELLPHGFLHVDAGCGTGVLMHMLRKSGWNSTGIDLSFAMLHTARRERGALPVAAGDLQAFPVRGAHFVTCLFDTINFLLEEEALRRVLREFAQALRPGGLLYFDAVTERMVTDHFDDQTWTEDNGRFRTTWSSNYDPATGLTETRVRVNTGGEALILERVYPTATIVQAIEDAGLTVLDTLDAFTWKRPTPRSTRLDFVAMKSPNQPHQALFSTLRSRLRQLL